MLRTGQWIWRDRSDESHGASRGEIDPKVDGNLFVQFRRSFQIDSVPASATLRVSADGRYRLYVNGAYVGRGPARCEPLFQYYDEYDIAPRLHAGANVIAVLAHSYGRDMSWYELPRTQWSRALGCGGIFVESEALDGIDSDAAWRCAIATAWRPDTAPGSVGFAEIYDARAEIDGWTDADFDDAGWEQAVVLATGGIGIAPPVVPFPLMVARDIPFLLEEPRDAVRIVSAVEAPIADAADEVRLADATPEPLAACGIENAEALLHEGDGEARVRLAPGRALSIVIDFGRTVAGYPRIAIDGPAGATVDVSYAERLRDDGRVTVQRPNPVTGQNVHRYILRDGAQAWEKFERAGFRYLQLTCSAPSGSAGATIAIRHANVNFTSYPVASRGAFACSDDGLTRIWNAGAYTLQLCMQDGFEDCPSREQQQWVGDAYVESLVNYASFGDTRLTAKEIRQVAQSQRRDGMTQMATPSDMSARWPLYIVDYCLSWILTIDEYVRHTGDESVLADIFPGVARAVAWFERQMGDAGLLFDPPGWIFIDWAEIDKRGASGALNALMVQALHAAATMADVEGSARLATRWRALAARINGHLNDLLWDEARGVYADALLDDGAQSRRVSQHTNVAMIAAGVAPRERWDRMLDYVMDPPRLAVTSTGMGVGAGLRAGGDVDEERQVILAQPFFMHFVHRALAAAGRESQIVGNIRRHWSPMLAGDGVDTLWEHWHGLDSRCHAWSATPVYDLSREVLGVAPIEPGFARFRIAPHLADLAWASGVYPSVRGDIGVEWRREAGRFTLEFGVPDGTEAEIVLPAGVTGARFDGDAIDGSEPFVAGAGQHRIEAAIAAPPLSAEIE